MRITNKIMQRNNLSNINNNKIYQDRLSTQMSTQKKISKASEDPVVAIRALRLRSNVTEVTQYYSKNIPDAKSWLSITEDALKNQSQVITSMIEQCTKASNGDLTNSDRRIILEQLKALGQEAYSTANADYAGRYVFTGYRTDTSLSFKESLELDYAITEQLHPTDLDVIKHVESGNLKNITEKNALTADIKAEDMSSIEIHRIRLAYKNCYYEENDGGTIPEITYLEKKTGAGGKVTYEKQSLGTPTVAYSYENPYQTVEENPDAIVYVPDTGEILLGKNKYDVLSSRKDDPATAGDESEIQVEYHKKDWVNGDLRPEHYFACEADGVTYNADYLNGTKERQDIEYDVGFNQTIRVNSTADECFQHGIGRTVDDLIAALDEVADLTDIKEILEKKKKDVEAGSAEAKALDAKIEAADKALALAKDKSQKLFERGITTFQNYLNDTSLSITNCGTRSKKLELIENRMQNQKTTFETLQSENEDIDIAEVSIQLTSAQLTYEAALMATGKVSQNTLLNFI